MRNPNVERLLSALLGQEKTAFLFSTLNQPSILADWEEGIVTRAELAQAMNMQIEQAQISPEQKQKIRQNMNQPFADAVKDAQAIVNDPKNADQALDRMYAIYAKHFTADELKQMVAFYKTPVGAKTLVEMPAVINETMQTGIGLFQPKLTALVEKTVKTQIDAANKK